MKMVMIIKTSLVVVMMIAWRECEWNSANLLQGDGDEFYDFRERFAPATLIEVPRFSLVPRTTGSVCRWECQACQTQNSQVCQKISSLSKNKAFFDLGMF